MTIELLTGDCDCGREHMPPSAHREPSVAEVFEWLRERGAINYEAAAYPIHEWAYRLVDQGQTLGEAIILAVDAALGGDDE